MSVAYAMVRVKEGGEMPAQTTRPRLTARFDEALGYAAELHRTQTRKGGDIPYLGHLLSVASLVIEGGGTEDQAIAGLLHDAVEDQGREGRTLVEIREKFGDDVATIVEECSDTDEVPKPPWKPRKEAYIKHLAKASEATVLVSLADKLDNARAILRDHRLVGNELWLRFSEKNPEEHLWYYGALLEAYKDRESTKSTWLVDELERVLGELRNRITEAANA